MLSISKAIRRVYVLGGLCLLWGMLCIGGCSEDTPTGPEKLNEAGFPLSVGNRWTYRAAAERTVSGMYELSLNWEVEVVWEIKAKEPVLGLEAFRMETVHHVLSGPEIGSRAVGETWFAVKGDTLCAVASRGTAGFFPASAQLHKNIAPYVQNAPSAWDVTVLILPLKIGKVWDYGASLFASDRKVVETQEKVTVPAGRFDAFRVVRVVDDPDAELRTEQWFTSVGLVKMREESVFIQDWYDETGDLIEEDAIVEFQSMTMELESHRIR